MINNVRRIVGEPINEVQRNFFDNLEGDSNIGWYTGKVVDNNDPDKQGKCRIRVYGIFGDEVPDEDLPWALPDFSFVGSLVGSFIVPPIDALVKVYFDHGDVYLPHYCTKAVVSNSQPTQKDINYPNNMIIYETDDGDYFTINRITKETTFNHNSGTKVLFKQNGDVEIVSNANINIESVGNTHIKHTGNLTVDGSVAIPVPQGGPFCALPSCLYTGAPHSGNVSPPSPGV
jgi:hypothetical protein